MSDLQRFSPDPEEGMLMGPPTAACTRCVRNRPPFTKLTNEFGQTAHLCTVCNALRISMNADAEWWASDEGKKAALHNKQVVQDREQRYREQQEQAARQQEASNRQLEAQTDYARIRALVEAEDEENEE